MDLFAEKTILSVSRLTALLRGLLEENFEHVWVRGEVSNLSQPSSGHIYFSIKDAGAQLRCVMFKGSARNIKFRLHDGMELVLRGRITVYDQRGDYQLIAEYIEPAGVGALQLAYEQLKKRLSQEGLFDDGHKKPLPPYPRRVGVITSPTGAAVHDILNVLKRRHAALEILLFPVRVQGEGAGAEIAFALDEMNRLGLADVIILGRGGGSIEDLWAFNEEVVARAVYHSRIPIVSAVGHETDWTISDFTADLRAPTPSAAAELVSASAEELRCRIKALDERLVNAIESLLATLELRLDSMKRLLHDPGSTLGHLSQRVDDLTERLEQALRASISRQRQRFLQLDGALQLHSPARRVDHLRQTLLLLATRSERRMLAILEEYQRRFNQDAARLEVLSPFGTLARGYSIVSRLADGTLVSDSKTLAPGEPLRINFRHGQAVCRVEKISE